MPGSFNPLLRRNSLEPNGHPGNAEIVMEGPEPSTSTVISIPAGDYEYKLVTGLELYRWYNIYAKAPLDAAAHYPFSVATRDDMPGAPALNNPEIYPIWTAIKLTWSAPFELGRITGGHWSIGSPVYVPAGKTAYVAPIWGTSSQNTARSPDPNPHDLPERRPICEGYPLRIPLGNKNYLCEDWARIALLALVIVVPTMLAGYTLFG